MKCGYCKTEITANGNKLPTFKVEKVHLQGSGVWGQQAIAVVCPFCEAVLGFKDDRTNA